MDIREIRIDQFGCWQDVAVHSLPIGINLIQLDDGGQPADFARFVHGVLFGFDAEHHTAAGGALFFDDGDTTISIDRQISSRGVSGLRTKRNGKLVPHDDTLVHQAQAGLDPRLAARFFVPTEDSSANWEWLFEHPELTDQLTDRQYQPVAVPLQQPREEQSHPKTAALQTSTSYARKLKTLQLEQEQLAAQLADRSRQLHEVEQSKSRSIPKVTIAEIDDELRMLEERQTPLEQAILLVKKWARWKKLRSAAGNDSELEELQAAFAKYKATEKNKRKHQRILAKRKAKPARSKPPRKPPTAGSPKKTLERLLAQRDWVLDASDSAFEPLESEFASTSTVQIRHAVDLVRAAQRDSEHADRALRQFTGQTGFDWSELEEPATVMRTEIGPDSPLADAPLSEQLDELKRRRAWVQQEYQCHVSNRSLSSQVRLWIVILFVLSIAALFGTLVVVSLLGQFVLIAMGLCGMASSGAIKLSLEKRAARKIHRTQERLQQIDREIAAVAEEQWDEEEARSLAAAREQKRLKASQLQLAANEANRRLDSAELAFRELLVSKGMSPTLSPDAALQQERYQAEWNSGTAAVTTNPKLMRWVKAARKFIRKHDGECCSEEPGELLASLELLSIQMSDRSRTANSTVKIQRKPANKPRDLTQAKRAARRELHRLDKIQQTILRRTKAHDIYELESTIEKVARRLEDRREWEELDHELSVYLDTHEDGIDIRELLEMYNAAELQRRYEETRQHQTELERLRNEQGLPRPDVNASQLQIEVQGLEERLSQLSADIASTQLAKDESEAQEKTIQLADKNAVKPEPASVQHSEPRFHFLRQMTNNEFDSIRLSSNQILLFNSETQHSRVAPVDSNEAHVAWLALRLRIASIHQQTSGQQTLPLVILADDLFALPNAGAIYNVLTTAVSSGLQILLLSGKQEVANQLLDAGVSAVRIGLQPSQNQTQTATAEIPMSWAA